MPKLSLEKLREALNAQEGCIKTLTAEIESVRETQKTLEERLGRMEHKLRDEKLGALITHEQIIVVTKLPRALLTLRKRFLDTLRAATSKDITIRARDELRQNASRLLRTLQGECDHRFVFSYDGYEEPPLGYSDGSSCCGARICQVCGRVEREKGPREERFEILQESDTRLVKRDLRDFSEMPWKNRPFLVQCEFIDIPVIKEVFWHSAGNMNIEWPRKRIARKDKEIAAA